MSTEPRENRVGGAAAPLPTASVEVATPADGSQAPGHPAGVATPAPALTFGSERDEDHGAAGLASARGGVTGQGFASVREAPEARKEHEES